MFRVKLFTSHYRGTFLTEFIDIDRYGTKYWFRIPIQFVSPGIFVREPHELQFFAFIPGVSRISPEGNSFKCFSIRQYIRQAGRLISVDQSEIVRLFIEIIPFFSYIITYFSKNGKIKYDDST